jgi:NAD(P)-dependent dehydrogenase (short-subunit alcohol dehydrogenase family)
MAMLAEKVAIITGAGRGLGYGEAIALAREGAAVSLIARTYDTVARVAKEIESFGGRALALACDVRRRDQVERAVDATIAEFGAIDILVNNAQIIPPATPAIEWTEEQMRDTWESGPLGTWFFMAACFPHMKDRGGRIINTCSASGYCTLYGYLGYDAAKEAIRSLTRTTAREWGQYGINVNAISPAAMTPRAAESMTEELEEAITSMLSIKRLGDPEKDIGRTVVFLAGPDAGYLTGNTVSVDGGLAMVV